MSLDTIIESPQRFTEMSFPPVMLQLMEEAVKPEPNFDRIASIISLDPALTAMVLNLVNSAFYSVSQKVVDLQRAAVVLGTKEILKLAISISYQQFMHGRLGDCGYDFYPDWRLTVWSSLAGEILAQRLCPEKTDQAYLCCLLKDVSLLFLKCAAPEELPDQSDGEPLTSLRPDQVEAETEAWGMHHGSLSQLLLTKWGLGEQACESIRATT